MASEVEKMLVAQNCSCYKPKSPVMASGIKNLSESCNNCLNYMNGECVKNMLDYMGNILRTN